MITLFPVPSSPLPKPRYTWNDAPSWWNPNGEEIAQERGEFVVLNYGGKLIPRTDLKLLSA